MARSLGARQRARRALMQQRRRESLNEAQRNALNAMDAGRHRERRANLSEAEANAIRVMDAERHPVRRAEANEIAREAGLPDGADILNQIETPTASQLEAFEADPKVAVAMMHEMGGLHRFRNADNLPTAEHILTVKRIGLLM